MKILDHAKQILLGISLAVILAASGCTATGSSREVPGWVLDPPAADAEFEYFAVSAEDSAGSVPAAQEAAVASLLTEINRVLGVDISVVSDAEIRGSLEDFEAELRQSVSETGAGRVAGFRIVDRYIQERESGVIVHLLASYEKVELEAERNARRALLQERENRILLPEQSGQRAEARGELYSAYVSYMDAALAAWESDLPNAELRTARNLEGARRALDAIRLEPAGAPDIMYLGRSLEDGFSVRVTNSDGRPVPRAAVIASYREIRPAGARQMEVRALSAADGTAVFSGDLLPGISGRLGQGFISFSLDTTPAIDNLRRAGLADQNRLRSVEERSAELRLRVSFSVQSLSPEIPTAVLYLQTDIAGFPIEGSGTRDGILQELAASGFIIEELNPREAERLESGQQALIEWFRSEYEGEIPRLVFGRGSIVEVDERDGYIVKVRGEILVYDYREDRIIFRSSGIKNSRGTGSAGAISSAFFNLGRDLAREAINALP